MKNLFNLFIGGPREVLEDLPKEMTYRVIESTTGKLLETRTNQPIPDDYRDKTEKEIQSYLNEIMFLNDDKHVVVRALY